MKTSLQIVHRLIKTGLYQSGPVMGIFGLVSVPVKLNLGPKTRLDWTLKHYLGQRIKVHDGPGLMLVWALEGR